MVLPEMWNCPYSNDSFPTYAEEVPTTSSSSSGGGSSGGEAGGGGSPSTAMLSAAAAENRVVLVGGRAIDGCVECSRSGLASGAGVRGWRRPACSGQGAASAAHVLSAPPSC